MISSDGNHKHDALRLVGQRPLTRSDDECGEKSRLHGAV